MEFEQPSLKILSLTLLLSTQQSIEVVWLHRELTFSWSLRARGSLWASSKLAHISSSCWIYAQAKSGTKGTVQMVAWVPILDKGHPIFCLYRQIVLLSATMRDTCYLCYWEGPGRNFFKNNGTTYKHRFGDEGMETWSQKKSSNGSVLFMLWLKLKHLVNNLM